MTETIYPRAPPPSSRSMVFVYGEGENIDLRGFVRKEKHGEIGRLDAVWLIVFFEFKRTEGVRNGRLFWKRVGGGGRGRGYL